jgi:N-acetylmuramic acid 6-phosphate etherase
MTTTETLSPRSRALDLWPDDAVLAALWESQLAAVAAVKGSLNTLASTAGAVAQRLRAGSGRLIYAGAGSSGLLAALDAMEMTPTFGWPAKRLLILMAGGDQARLRPVGVVEDSEGAGVEDVKQNAIGAADVVIGVAASGTTPYTIAVVEHSRSLGALTVGVANNPATPLLAAAEFPIVVATGAEVIAGSTRLKAGTAQKVVLGLLSTLVMTRMGHVFDGWMVSLDADNAKLWQRATRMVADIGRVDEMAAEAALRTSEGRVKEAVLIVRGLTPGQARERLAEHGGNLRDALEAAEAARD